MRNCVPWGRFYPIAHRNDDIKILVVNLSFYFTVALLSNLSEFPTSSNLPKLTIIKEVGNMLCYLASAFAK